METRRADRATIHALDSQLRDPRKPFLSAGVNAAAAFGQTATITIERAPVLWIAAHADAPDLVLTINAEWWAALTYDQRAKTLINTLQRAKPVTTDGKTPSTNRGNVVTNHLNRTEIVIT